MRALITGATGFVGQRLFEQIDDPVVLSRNADRARQQLGRGEFFNWDPLSEPPPKEAFRGVQAVFHLAGDPVADSRWTDAKKRRIRDSRVLGTRNLVRGLEACDERPAVLVSASAVGWYGSRGNEVLDETSPPADDFLADVCIAWEDAAAPARELGLRVVQARIGIVLGPGAGALAKMLLPFRLGLGGRIGHGHQYMPWIHVDDVVGLLLHAAQATEISGPMNTVGPEPVTNREFTRALAAALHRPALFPVPAVGLRVLLGEFANVLVASQRVYPRVAEKTGYKFHYTTIDAALRAALSDTAQRHTAEQAVGAH